MGTPPLRGGSGRWRTVSLTSSFHHQGGRLPAALDGDWPTLIICLAPGEPYCKVRFGAWALRRPSLWGDFAPFEWRQRPLELCQWPLEERQRALEERQWPLELCQWPLEERRWPLEEHQRSLEERRWPLTERE
jgi:hypothetical protein